MRSILANANRVVNFKTLEVAVLGLEVLCNFGAKIVLEFLHLLVPVAEVHLAVECVKSVEGDIGRGA